MIIHERADGTIVTSMAGVKAPAKASMILGSSETFAEVLRKEVRKIEKTNHTSVCSLSYLCAGKGRG